MLLVLAIVLLVISIAGGVIVHPLLFLLAILALLAFFSGRRGAVYRFFCASPSGSWPVPAAAQPAAPTT
jgi:hypothetical protein